MNNTKKNAFDDSGTALAPKRHNDASICGKIAKAVSWNDSGELNVSIID